MLVSSGFKRGVRYDVVIIAIPNVLVCVSFIHWGYVVMAAVAKTVELNRFGLSCELGNWIVCASTTTIRILFFSPFQNFIDGVTSTFGETAEHFGFRVRGVEAIVP